MNFFEWKVYKKIVYQEFLLAHNLYWDTKNTSIWKGGTLLDAINGGGKTKRNVEDTLTSIETDIESVVSIIGELLPS